MDNPGTVLRGEETTVLVVEDDLSIGEMLVMGLTHYGFKPRFLSNVESAKRLLEEWKPDFILSDYHLGDATGEQVLALVMSRYPDLIAANRFQFITGEPSFVSTIERPVEIKVHAKPFSIRSIARSLIHCPSLDAPSVVAAAAGIPLNGDKLALSNC